MQVLTNELRRHYLAFAFTSIDPPVEVLGSECVDGVIKTCRRVIFYDDGCRMCGWTGDYLQQNPCIHITSLIENKCDSLKLILCEQCQQMIMWVGVYVNPC